MAAPQITPLPTPPVRSDAPADFSSKADAFVAALPPFVTQANAQADFNDQRADDSDASANAASNSAAAASASAANAADQVVLATAEADRSQGAADQAEIFAAAASAAIGLPALMGNGGLALVVKSDETGVEWGSSAQSIGDLLITARDPGNTFIPGDDGGIYLQASYPDLFSIVGLTGGEPANSWTTQSSIGAGFWADVKYIESTGEWVACASVLVKTSIDQGATWETKLTSANSLQSIGIQGSVILVGGQGAASAPVIMKTSTSFEAPVETILPGATGFVSCIAGNGGGIWLAGLGDGRCFRSTDNGDSWSLVTTGAAGIFNRTSIAFGKDGVVIIATGAAQLRKSLDSGATWAALTATGATNPAGIATDGDGVWVVSSQLTASGSSRSINNGVTWSALGPQASGGVIATDKKGVWVGTTNSRSKDNGATWVTATGKPNTTLSLAAGADGVWMGGANNNVIIGKPSYTFDPLTQFKAPEITITSSGLTPYIKAKNV